MLVLKGKKINYSIFSAEVNPSEESDGISVISESEFKASTNNSDNEEKKEAVDDVESEGEFKPLTPPMTPEIFTKAKAVKEPKRETERRETGVETTSGNKTWIVGVLVCVVASILYSHIRSEIQSINMKLAQLEQENQLLKTSLDKLEAALIEPVSVYSEPLSDALPILKNRPNHNKKNTPNLQKPKTKTVWLGNEKEDKVEILDKKQNNFLPDYCYFTDENDLFYEYNVEICNAKLRKLAAKNSQTDKKIEKDIKVIDPWKIEDGESYDTYIAETLKSLNDEIQEIKAARSPVDSSETNPTINDDVKETSTKPKNDQQEPPKSKGEKRPEKKRLSRQKAVKSGEWVEKRTHGREEARKDKEKQEDSVNWYLKRKNEREINRLQVETENQEL